MSLGSLVTGRGRFAGDGGRTTVAARAIAWLVALAALLFSMACEPQIAPPLVEVTELVPREIEPGDRLEIHGSGFPQGRTGRVELRGTVHRAGEPPLRGVTIEASGTVSLPDRLEIVVRDPLAERFCGAGEGAVHATFRGDVEVSFASTVDGAPPLVGVLRGATLDVQPSWTHKASLEARSAEGARLLAFMGIVPGAVTARGVPVEQVQLGSLANEAGIQVGDVIVGVDGVNVLSLGDLVPASARSVDLTIVHGESGAEETKTLSVVEFAGERVPTEYAPALVVVGLALAVLVLLVLPGPASLGVVERRIAARLRGTTPRALFVALLGSGRHAALSALLSAVVAAFALTPYVVGAELDGALLLAGSASLLVWSRVATARGFVASIKTGALTLTATLAMVAAIALAVAHVGAIELNEIVRVQGALPWEFSAARHPARATLAVIYLGALVTILRARPAGAAPPPPHASLLARAGLILAAALGAMVFFGGWQLPGIHGRAMTLLAAGVLVAKTWTIVAIVDGARGVAQDLGPREVALVALRRLVPALVLAGAALVASRRFAPSSALETAFGATLVAVTVLFVVRVVTRVRATVTRPQTHASPIL